MSGTIYKSSESTIDDVKESTEEQDIDQIGETEVEADGNGQDVTLFRDVLITTKIFILKAWPMRISRPAVDSSNPFPGTRFCTQSPNLWSKTPKRMTLSFEMAMAPIITMTLKMSLFLRTTWNLMILASKRMRRSLNS